MSVASVAAAARMHRTKKQQPDLFALKSLSAQWPAPIDEAALHGLAGDVVRTITPHSEADPVALLLQFLAAFGNAAGRPHCYMAEGDRHPPQLWPLLVGETSKGRKGTAWGRIIQLFELAVPEWVRDRQGEGGLSSGEGLIWEVRDPIVQRIRDKKTGEYAENETDPGVDDKRLFVIETEFASTLRQFERSGNTLSSTLRQFWDRGNVRLRTKNSPIRTTGAMLGVIGHITEDELHRYLTRTEMANGLANRFLFVCVRRANVLPFGGGAVDLSQLAARVTYALSRAWQRDPAEIGWARGANDIWAGIYPSLSEGKPGLFGAVISRAEAQTIRLAVTYALLDGSLRLTPDHINAALAVWRYCEGSAAYLFGTSLGDPVADALLGALKASPDGLTRTDIRDLFSRHERSAVIDTALTELIAQGLARCASEATAGRPVERWTAVRPNGQ